MHEFKEKPDTETAKRYLKKNAVWNAGVFAFKLGYLMDKAHNMLDFKDYQDLYDHYDTVKKISFDYAVVEKEKSIQMMRYEGSWKDVGTWNMMAEVMSDNIKGKAVMDETCSNTQIVNELNIPILAMGCKDMVIAASGDGIFVSDKEQSGYMKPYVEKICSDIKFAEKSWGTYTVIDAEPGAMAIKLSMRAGEHMSYHSHENRSEVWTIINGSGSVVIDDVEQKVITGDIISIKAGVKHMLMAETDLSILEIQIGKEISVEDKQKYVRE